MIGPAHALGLNDVIGLGASKGNKRALEKEADMPVQMLSVQGGMNKDKIRFRVPEARHQDAKWLRTMGISQQLNVFNSQMNRSAAAEVRLFKSVICTVDPKPWRACTTSSALRKKSINTPLTPVVPCSAKYPAPYAEQSRSWRLQSSSQ